MEEVLREELINKIPELLNSVFPTNAPEEADKPYLVYARINTRKIKTLKGFTDKQELSYMFSVMASRYEDMKSLRDKVEALLSSIPKTTIGEEEVFVDDVNINNIDEAWESELKIHRGIIDFTIYF